MVRYTHIPGTHTTNQLLCCMQFYRSPNSERLSSTALCTCTSCPFESKCSQPNKMIHSAHGFGCAYHSVVEWQDILRETRETKERLPPRLHLIGVDTGVQLVCSRSVKGAILHGLLHHRPTKTEPKNLRKYIVLCCWYQYSLNNDNCDLSSMLQAITGDPSSSLHSIAEHYHISK